ncbi:MAG: YlxR family protein [Mycobacteriales bacterium]
MVRRTTPVRTCVGCRSRASKPDLLRVVGVSAALVPDPRGRLPGRGAFVHLDPGCLDLAERQRAFPRALRLAGPFDAGSLRAYVEEQASVRRTVGKTVESEAGRDGE